MIDRLMIRKGKVRPPKAFGTNPLVVPLAGVVAVWLFLTYIGVPYLRTDYTYRPLGERKVYVSATYRTFGGQFVASPYDLGSHTCPLVVLRPLETPLLERLDRWIFNRESSTPSGDADRTD